jgi:hypothetical protein
MLGLITERHHRLSVGGGAAVNPHLLVAINPIAARRSTTSGMFLLVASDQRGLL